VRQTGVSRADRLVCPACGHGALRRRGFLSRWAECESCSRAFDGATVGTLEQIAALPDAQGEHACECGHPYMRSLPDATFHCPACRSEVVAAEPVSAPSRAAHKRRRTKGEQRRGAGTTGLARRGPEGG
jgi:ribosomal protein L37AE/L43A